MLELARSWVDGWAVSRRVPKPVEMPWGLTVRVGLPAQPVRHVLLGADAGTARELVGTVTEPATCIKGFLAPDVMEPWFPPGWEPVDPGFLMAVDLRPSAVRPPEGYTATAESAGGVIGVRVRTAVGELAAGGRIGMTDGGCVFDQIVTEAAHQRLGLGTAVVGALTNAAIEHGASTGVLGATLQGRALYETLGWKVLAPLTGFVYGPVTP
ncbi:GNAT family N-acetyltransferase [Streptomyces sp. CAU 1734]|uniref:GNAT family N-acetyltransferase n=1 Tax=Streptomyces sp. CAU 1734 TaxID=3140360 RepID=UPI00326003E6